VALQQTILVERYYDANANGHVDSGETLLLSFRVTDGKVEMFGGVPNEAVPGDNDGATNGQLSVVLRLNDLPENNRLVGNYVFRVSPLDASFSPLDAPFVVAQSTQSQTIRGTVTANGSPLPGAVVVALVPEGDGANFAAGVFTDGSGAFALNLPAGDYGLIGFKRGFVSSFDSAPQVSLASGSSVTQAVVLSSASRTVSGRVIDAVTSNGIAGLQLFAESSSGDVALATTDAAGNFSLDAGIGEIRMNPSEQGLRLLGYTARDYTFDTTAGDVSSVLIRLSKGRGRFQLAFFFPNGYFGNGTNASVTFPTQLNYYFAMFDLNDANFPTNVLFTGPSGSGLANTPSAYYGINDRGDSAYYSSPQVNVPQFPPGGVYTVTYKGQPLDFALPDPQAQNRQVLLVPRVTLDAQNQVTEILWDRRGTNGNTLASAPFIARIQVRIEGNQGDRLYESDVAPDATSHALSYPVTWTNVSSIQMAYDDDLGNQYTCFWHRGFQPVGGGPARVEPKFASPGHFELRVFGQAGQTYTIQYSTDLRNWFPLQTTVAPGNWFDIVDNNATNSMRFYRVSQP